MGNKQSVVTTVSIAGGLVVVGASYWAYRYCISRTFEGRLQGDLDSLGDIRVKVDGTIDGETVVKIIVIIFKYSYEYRKAEKDAKRAERVALLRARRFDDYALKCIETEQLEQECSMTIKARVFQHANINDGIYLRTQAKEKARLSDCSVRALDSLKLEVKLAKKEAKELKQSKDELQAELQAEGNIVTSITREGQLECYHKLGVNWSDKLKTMLLLDKLYLKYCIGQYEIAATLRKYAFELV